MCTHQAHLCFDLKIQKKTSKWPYRKIFLYVPFGCTYWDTFMASHNQKMRYFWKLALFKGQKTQNRKFRRPPLNFFGMWYVHMTFIYVNYLYLAHSEMISETKYVHPCGTHTSFFQKKFFWRKKISVVGPVCAVWVHILCLIIHFLEVQIWFFICVKSQFAVWSGNAKVGGDKFGARKLPTFSLRFKCKSRWWSRGLSVSFVGWFFLRFIYHGGPNLGS